MSIGSAAGSFLSGIGEGYISTRQTERDAMIARLLDERNATPATLASTATPPMASGTTPSTDGGATPSTGDLTPDALYGYFTSKGATRNEAAMLTGMAQAESNLNPTLSHDRGTGYGLFGHRLDRRDAMFKFAGTDKPAWNQQADFALQELRSRPESARVNAAKNPYELTVAGMGYERPRGYTDANPAAGHNFEGRQRYVGNMFGRDASATPRSITPTTPSKKTSGDALDLMGSLFPQRRGVVR